VETLDEHGGNEAEPLMQAADVSDRRSSMVTNNSSPGTKIELFRSLFRGREDVYPRHFVSRKTGKARYAPACANEWILGICEKPRIKCTDCPNRRFFQITDEVIGWHLSGRDDRGSDFVMGIYAMLQDETCFFLVVRCVFPKTRLPEGEKWLYPTREYFTPFGRHRGRATIVSHERS
jgi:hypothetical protein